MKTALSFFVAFLGIFFVQVALGKGVFSIQFSDTKKGVLNTASTCAANEAKFPLFQVNAVPKGTQSLLVVMSTETPAQEAISDPAWQLNFVVYDLPAKNGKVDLNKGSFLFGNLEDKEMKSHFLPPCPKSPSAKVRLTAYALSVAPKFFVPPSYKDLLSVTKESSLGKAEVLLSLPNFKK